MNIRFVLFVHSFRNLELESVVTDCSCDIVPLVELVRISELYDSDKNRVDPSYDQHLHGKVPIDVLSLLKFTL